MIIERRGLYAGYGTRELVLEGAGPETILLHGFADSADTWRLVLAELDRRGQAARALDLPGFGHADPLRPGPVLAQLDAFVSAVLDVHGDASHTVLVGNSLGSVLAMRAASRSEARISRVVAIATPTAFSPLLRTVRRSSFALPLVARLPVPDRLLVRPAQFALRKALYGTRQSSDVQVIERFRSQLLDMRAVAELLRNGCVVTTAIGAAIVPEQLQRPTTVVQGTRDVFISTRTAVRLHAALPDSRLVVLPGVGHCPQLETPDTIADLIG